MELLFVVWNSIVLWENSHTNEIVFLTAKGQHFHNGNWEACVETSWDIRVIRFLNRITSVQHPPSIVGIVLVKFSVLHWIFAY